MKDIREDVANENSESGKTGDKQYAFITETIKKRPVNKKKVFAKVLFTIALALIFGVVSCVTFAVLYPYVEQKINPVATKEVKLPVTEEIPEPVEEFVPSEEDEIDEVGRLDEIGEADETKQQTDSENDKTGESDTVNSETDSLQNVDSEIEKAIDEKKEVVVNQVVETVQKDLELDDYRMLYRKISSVGDSVKNSMVTVSGISSDTDWFNNKYENNNSAAGVIVADNGKEILIASLSDILKDADEVEVTFCDGKSYASTIKKTDPSTNLMVLGVEIEDIDPATMSRIEMATFGSTTSMMVGTPVLAVGSVQGIPDSMSLGQITSASTNVDIIDGSVKVISTDIYGSTTASGVIVNLNGRILGFICNEPIVSDMPNLIRAYSITDLKDKIEKISNGQSLAKLGIIGTDVTEKAYNDLGVPFGTYVKKVDIDSPAMDAGIRSGDVIVKFGTTSVNSFTDYKSALLKAQAGDTIVISLMRPGREKYMEVTYEIALESF